MTDSTYFGLYFCGLFVTWSLFIICLLFSGLQRNSFLWILTSHSHEFLYVNFVRHEKWCVFFKNRPYFDHYKVQAEHCSIISLVIIFYHSASLLPFDQILRAFAKLQRATKSFVIYHLSVLSHGTTRLPMYGFSWNMIFENFLKICRDSASFITIREEWKVHLW
jgi:hypothetical protein